MRFWLRFVSGVTGGEGGDCGDWDDDDDDENDDGIGEKSLSCDEYCESPSKEVGGVLGEIESFEDFSDGE